MASNQPGEIIALPVLFFQSSRAVGESFSVDSANTRGHIQLLLGELVGVEDDSPSCRLIRFWTYRIVFTLHWGSCCR